MTPGKVISPEHRRGYRRKKIPIFCLNVQKRRLELDITQEKLAQLVNWDRSRISLLEGGTLPRDEDKIIAIAKALKTDINWLFGFVPEDNI